MKLRALLLTGLLARASVVLPAAEPPAPPPASAVVRFLLPGFTVRELPVQLTSLNNIEYAPDGRLFAGGYDGRFHLLRDTDGDGLEDRVDTFSPATSANYPLGMAVQDGMPYAVLTDEIVRWRDTDGDGIPDARETVVKGFDDPELVKATFLEHRRVDGSMALAFGPDGSLYVTMGNSAPVNAYWTDQAGAHYAPERRRGCLLRISPEGQVEQVCTGLRYIMALQFNEHGDLFGTDQEGATWVPNGNPFDELLHLQPGRHYGFPPRHPRFLPHVIDEPSVWDYAPQHQSACGFRFNGPAPGRARFGPELWAHDALVTGESRGKLWRTHLLKTAAGYVARTEQFAALGMLVVDCAVSPAGDLVVCCHAGAPDWGEGPPGRGRLFKIHYADPAAPQPVLTYAAGEQETVIAFDRPLPADWAPGVGGQTRIEFGRYVAAADRWETFRPGYAVVKMQQEQPRRALAVQTARLSADRRNLILETEPRRRALNYAVAVGGAHPLDVAHDLSGLAAAWRGAAGPTWTGWLPHADLAVARDFTRGSVLHEALRTRLEQPGELTLRAQLDLWQMLQPATQPLSHLDYVPDPETVTLEFQADAPLELTAPGARIERAGPNGVRLTLAGPRENQWLPVELKLRTPARELAVSYHTSADPRPRTLSTRRFLLPFATPGEPDLRNQRIPQIAGGDWHAGRALFNGKATCSTCHRLRGEGFPVGPELANLTQRDYAGVLRDIVEPNATINPDAVGYLVTLRNGESFTGTRLAETDTELQLAQPGGQVAKLLKSEITQSTPMAVSLMPTGLDKALTPAELRDLMTYLLTEPEPPVPTPASRREPGR